MKTSLTLAILQNLLQSFSTRFCITLEYVPIKGSFKILQKVFYGIINHAKNVLVLKCDLLQIFGINIKTCPNTINTTHAINLCFN